MRTALAGRAGRLLSVGAARPPAGESRGPAGPSIAELARSTLLAVLALACVIPPGALATSTTTPTGRRRWRCTRTSGWWRVVFPRGRRDMGGLLPGGLSASFAVSTWAERLDRTVYANLTNADATSLEAPGMRRLVQVFHPTRKPHARPELRDQHDVTCRPRHVRHGRDRGVRRGDQVRRPEHRRRREGEQRQRHGSHEVERPEARVPGDGVPERGVDGRMDRRRQHQRHGGRSQRVWRGAGHGRSKSHAGGD